MLELERIIQVKEIESLIIYTHIERHTYTLTYKHIYRKTHIYTYIQIHMYKEIYTYTHMCKRK